MAAISSNGLLRAVHAPPTTYYTYAHAHATQYIRVYLRLDVLLQRAASLLLTAATVRRLYVPHRTLSATL
jgi:hypothetical protein